ncbi:MAG TPA: FAD-dependent oxidoreductase [Paracoccaceae bacterium]|nr:FAD-dependent oxidoreductase [Paracoccaceae bacterium]HMO72294.1 FAD-dependent oxidoreductase [Paracoccaceae bacterium]
MARPDLAVMGAGVFGLCTALAAVQHGARVQLIDPAGPGAGASGGVVGALMPMSPARWDGMHALQLRALVMAGDWWKGVEAASGLSTGYGATGRLMPLADAAAAQATVAGAARHWGSAGAMVVEPAPPGWAPAGGTGLVLRDTLSARLRPMAAVQAMVAAVQAKGGEILRGDQPPDGVSAVWATGAAGLALLRDGRGQPAGQAVKGQAAVLAFDTGPDAPQIYADGLHIVPHDNGTVAVGSTSETVFDSPGATDELLCAVIARARAACPILADAPVLHRWAGLRPRAATRRPLVGPWPGRPGHFVANGGFRTGFAMAPLIGSIAAAMALGDETGAPAGCGTDWLAEGRV